ncbi:ACT domain-containing protein [Hippea alviniae]|uniref:ACT domain-containing protein n=1 Tax=Hippea alviniae TaxID=1279027 RepID=UPI0003B73025|nr:ACT domain-containing protein [Hippea alviniae]
MKRIRQISVFVENRPGRLLEVVELLGKHSINIKALSLADSTDFGIVRLVVKGTDDAIRVLKENGFTIAETHIIACMIDDKPGALANVLKILADNQINIEYMYGFASPIEGKAVMVFKFSETEKAEKILSENNIQMLSQEEIREI